LVGEIHTDLTDGGTPMHGEVGIIIIHIGIMDGVTTDGVTTVGTITGLTIKDLLMEC
jgi:hypothetical protein